MMVIQYCNLTEGIYWISCICLIFQWCCFSVSHVNKKPDQKQQPFLLKVYLLWVASFSAKTEYYLCVVFIIIIRCINNVIDPQNQVFGYDPMGYVSNKNYFSIKVYTSFIKFIVANNVKVNNPPALRVQAVY